MENIVTVSIDETEIRKLFNERVEALLHEIDSEYVFWDTAELKKRTCMSWNTIQDTFFYDPRFPKRKVGGKWYFPVDETKNFLELWLAEQPK